MITLKYMPKLEIAVLLKQNHTSRFYFELIHHTEHLLPYFSYCSRGILVTARERAEKMVLLTHYLLGAFFCGQVQLTCAV